MYGLVLHAILWDENYKWHITFNKDIFGEICDTDWNILMANLEYYEMISKKKKK